MELIYKEVFFRSHGNILNWGLKRSRFGAALNGHFPTYSLSMDAAILSPR